MNINAKSKQNNNVLYYEANGGGIDTNNLLATFSSGDMTYTTTEDCWINPGATSYTYLNDATFISTHRFIFVKKGQTVKFVNLNTSYPAKIFGIKHN